MYLRETSRYEIDRVLRTDIHVLMDLVLEPQNPILYQYHFLSPDIRFTIEETAIPVYFTSLYLLYSRFE